MTILPTGRVGPMAGRPVSVVRPAAGFVMPGEVRASATSAATPVDLGAFLSLQEFEPAQERDRRARRHGQSLLEALTRLQQVLLGDGDEAASLQVLAELACSTPDAADPGLRAVIEAISLRAHVELAHRAVAAARLAGHRAAPCDGPGVAPDIAPDITAYIAGYIAPWRGPE